jgi:formamidopyrimidine-DNA glycosylase
MPELPEVELVSRSLDRLVKGRRILAARLLRERLAPATHPKVFSRLLRNSSINFVHRRGKHVLFDLDSGYTLMTHLRMSGRFFLLPPDKEFPKFTHAVFQLDDASRLVFQDQRHFGFMKLVRTSEMEQTKEIAKLAPEPFSDEFSPEYLRGRLRGSNRSIKEFLLDQTKVCGLGNIYASEVLFLSGVHPAKIAGRISRTMAAEIRARTIQVLSEAISAGSTLNVDPENMDGSYNGGVYESHWRVYDREQMPCPSCETPVRRIRQGARSSYFCPKCQKK